MSATLSAPTARRAALHSPRRSAAGAALLLALLVALAGAVQLGAVPVAASDWWAMRCSKASGAVPSASA